MHVHCQSIIGIFFSSLFLSFAILLSLSLSFWTRLCKSVELNSNIMAKKQKVCGETNTWKCIFESICKLWGKRHTLPHIACMCVETLNASHFVENYSNDNFHIEGACVCACMCASVLQSFEPKNNNETALKITCYSSSLSN